MLHSHEAAVQELLQADGYYLDLEVDTDEPLGSALWAAVNLRNVEIAKMLLDNGVFLESRGSVYGTTDESWSEECKVTPLWEAVGRRHLSMVDLVLSRGADIMAMGQPRSVSTATWHMNGPHTLLEAAAYLGDPGIVMKLLDFGAGADVVSMMNALCIARDCESHVISELLQQWEPV